VSSKIEEVSEKLIREGNLECSPLGSVEKPEKRSAPACWCGFKENLTYGNSITFKSSKIAQMGTPKTTFSTIPLGELYKKLLIVKTLQVKLKLDTPESLIQIWLFQKPLEGVFEKLIQVYEKFLRST
jgi:hypothetical protein